MDALAQERSRKDFSTNIFGNLMADLDDTYTEIDSDSNDLSKISLPVPLSTVMSTKACKYTERSGITVAPYCDIMWLWIVYTSNVPMVPFFTDVSLYNASVIFSKYKCH